MNSQAVQIPKEGYFKNFPSHPMLQQSYIVRWSSSFRSRKPIRSSTLFISRFYSCVSLSRKQIDCSWKYDSYNLIECYYHYPLSNSTLSNRNPFFIVATLLYVLENGKFSLSLFRNANYPPTPFIHYALRGSFISICQSRLTSRFFSFFFFFVHFGKKIPAIFARDLSDDFAKCTL